MEPHVVQHVRLIRVRPLLENEGERHSQEAGAAASSEQPDKEEDLSRQPESSSAKRQDTYPHPLSPIPEQLSPEPSSISSIEQIPDPERLSNIPEEQSPEPDRIERIPYPEQLSPEPQALSAEQHWWRTLPSVNDFRNAFRRAVSTLWTFCERIIPGQESDSEGNPWEMRATTSSEVPKEEEQPDLEPDLSSVQQNPDLEQASEPQPVRTEQRWWRIRLRLSTFRTFVTNIPFVTVLHWLLTFAAIIAFFVGLVFHWWRVIRVDREALLSLRHIEKIDALLRTSTITLTRSQIIYWECLVDSQGEFGKLVRARLRIKNLNETSTIMRPMCHRILDGIQYSYSFHKRGDIISNIKSEMILCPIVLSIALLTTVSQATSEFCERRRLFLLLTAGVRVLNTVLCLIIIVCSVMLDHHFHAADPGFPVSWPKEVRDATTVETWHAGAVDWVLGMIFQFAALLLDLRRMHLRESL